MYVTLDHIEDNARYIKTFWFRPEGRVRHVAGQFTQINLPLDHPDERGSKHWFTISSSPTEALLGITSKFAPGQSSTFKQALANLEPGARLTLAEPMGDFVLPKDKTIPLLFVAGGIGITPYRSLAKWLIDKGEKRDVHLAYSTRTAEELAFLDIFKSYDMKFTPVVTEPTKEWKGQTGVLTAKQILRLADVQGPRTLVYIAGPEPMVEQFVDELRSLGIANHRLVTDYFPGYEGL